MKDRILFWADLELVHFGIAKFLQEKYDCDLFVIYDVNSKIKSSFMTQKSVKFNKEWFYWDHLSKIPSKPDLEYLKSFEEKYKINLWMIAYSERIFYKYNPNYKFKEDEILSILETECRLYEEILDEVKPDYLAIKLTDFHRNHLLAEMCKSRGTRVLMLIPTRLANRTAISSDMSKIDNAVMPEDTQEEETKSLSELQKYLDGSYKVVADNIDSRGLHLSPLKKIKLGLHWMTKTYDKEYKNTYDHFGVTRSKVISWEISSSVKRRFRKSFMDKNFITKIDPEEKFIYFPLHQEPERALSIGAPFYSNQLTVVKYIAKSIPIGYKLYVKDHPFQLDRYRSWRELSFYKAILDLPNVRLVHPFVKTQEILSKCSLVITISGTTGLEAAFNKKPSIVFVDVMYSSLPSVHKLKSLNELPAAIETSLKKEVDIRDLQKFIRFVEANSFEYDMDSLHGAVMRKFHNDSFMIADMLSANELDLFLEEHRNEFEKLVDAHINKICQYKEKNRNNRN